MESAGRPPGVGAEPPPGWYPDPEGQIRWWDGNGWTADVQLTAGGPGPMPVGTMGAGPVRPNTTLALVANIGGLIGGFIPSLVVYLIDGGKDRFVRHNAAEALNFQITLQIVSLLLFVPFFAVFFAQTASLRPGQSIGGLVGAMMFMVVCSLVISGCNIVWSIIGMVRANRLEYWRYPVRIKFVKGSLEPGELFPTP